MKKLFNRFGKYNVTAFIIMAVGIILWLLTPLLLWLFNFDSDIIGLLVFIIGLLMFIIGLFARLFKQKVK